MVPLESRQRTLLVLLVIGGSLLRVAYWHWTGSTLEDAFITFRYAENLASGNGFVYNTGEHVLGTTTPLWTLFLAGVRSIGIPEITSCAKVIALVLEALSMLAVFALLRQSGLFASFAGTALYCSSPAIVPISISGMESPLLIACMCLALLGYQRRSALFGIGLALTLLTRIDGAIFVLTMLCAALLQERRWALKQGALALALCLPWFLFSLAYFGSLLPESVLAKHAVYQSDVRNSLRPFLVQFTPFLEVRAAALVAKGVFFLLLLAGLIRSVRSERHLLPLSAFFIAYVAVFGASGILVFSWYLVPAAFASMFLIALGADWCLSFAASVSRRALLLRALALWGLPIGLCAVHLATLHSRAEHSKQLQAVEEHLRKEVGLYLCAQAPAGSQVFLEPLGYMGYYAGSALTIHDEVGLVTPAVIPYRSSGDGWYVPALKDLRPDYVVQYAYALEQNMTEGSEVRLFRDERERAWFREHYMEQRTFDATEISPLIAMKEKKFVLFIRSGKEDPPGGGSPPLRSATPLPAKHLGEQRGAPHEG